MAIPIDMAVEPHKDIPGGFPWRGREGLLLLLATLGGLYEAAGRFYWSGFSFTLDHVPNIVGARWLLAGEGVSAPFVDPSNLGNFEYRAILKWPPGYSAALAGFWTITGDVVKATLALDCVVMLLLFWSWWAICYQLRSSLGFGTRLCLVGWWVVFASPAWNTGHTDIFSFGLFIFSTALTLSASRNSNRILFVAAGLASGVAASARYAYWPLIVVGPIATWIAGQRRGRLWNSALQGVAGAIVVGALYLRNLMLSRSGESLSSFAEGQAPGFYPWQLVEMAPFPLAVFGTYGPYAPGGFLSALSSNLQTAVAVLIWLLCVCVGAAAVWGLAKLYREGGDNGVGKSAGCAALAATYSMGAAALTLSLLTYLSVCKFYSEYPNPGDRWVAVSEIRYYMPLAPALFLGVAWFYERRRSLSLGIRRAIGGGLILTAILSAAPAAMRLKRVTEVHLLATPPARQVEALKYRGAISEQIERARSAGSPVVYLDQDLHRREWAEIEGAAVVWISRVSSLGPDLCASVSVVAALSDAESSIEMLTLWERLHSVGGRESGRYEDLRFMTCAADSGRF